MCLTQISEIVSDYRSEVTRQPWEKVDGKRLKRLFEDYMLYGVIHDEKGLWSIAERFVDLVHKMQANTILMGHTPLSPESIIREVVEEPFSYDDEFEEWLCNYVTDPDQNSWRISDYAIDNLLKLASSLSRDKSTNEETLQIINKILMVAHQRTDLAELFVSGGVELLDDIAN